MSRISLFPDSASFSYTTSRIFTLRGTVKCMPRSWHSATSDLNFRLTGSPQISQCATRLSFDHPQSGHVRRGALGFWEIVFLPHFVQAILRCSNPSSLPHLHSQFPLAYSTNSTDPVCRKSEIGKIGLNAACRPVSSRSAGAV